MALRPDSPYNPVQSVVPEVQQPNDYIRADASPADFGSQVGAATQGLGQNVEKAGDAATDYAVQMQGVYNRTASDHATNSFMDQAQAIQYGDHNDPNDQGFFGLRGAAALSARGPAIQKLQDLQAQLGNGLQNLQQRQQFDESSRRAMLMISDQMNAHADRQFDEWTAQTQRATQDLALRSIGAAPSDETAFQSGLIQGMDGAGKAVEQSGGSIDAVNAAKLDFRAKAYANRAETWGATDPVAALNFVTTNQGKFDGPAFAALTDRLKPKAEAINAQHIVDGIMPLPGSLGPASTAVQTAAVAQGVDPVAAQTVAQLETQGGAKPDRPNSQYSGVFQLGSSEFTQNGGTTRGDVNQEASAGVANLKRIQPIADAAVGGHAQPWQVYVMHQQGDKGGAALLRADPSQNALDALTPAYGGDKATATAAIVQNGGIPSGTVGQFLGQWQQKYSAAELQVRGAMIGQHGYPDMPGLEQKVLDVTGNDPDLRHEALSQLHQRMSIFTVQADQAKEELSHTLTGTNAALLSGDTSATIPESTIRAAYPAPEADRIVSDLNVSKQAGQLIKTLQFATPPQVQTTMADLGTPDGRLGTLLRIADQTGTPDANALPPETPDQTLRRQSILKLADEALTARQTALRDDPAAYVAQEPSVAAALRSVNDKDPATFEAYARSSRAMQTALGVPEQSQHILTAPQAKAMAGRLASATPATTDTGSLLAQTAQQYGAAWPQAFGDLVTLGKLPGEFQVLAAMPDPVARTDFQRALGAIAAKGGIAQLRDDVPPQAAKDIDAGLDDKLDEFRQTASVPGLSSNIGLLTTVRNSVKDLAYYYATQSGDGTAALQKATDAVINNKYDFAGSMRVPKGMLPVAETASANLVSSLKAGDLMPMAADTQATASGPGMTTEQRQAVTLRAAQHGSWVPNESDSGLVLVSRLTNGAMVQIRRADGSRVELPFARMSAMAKPAAPPMPATAESSTILGAVQ